MAIEQRAPGVARQAPQRPARPRQRREREEELLVWPDLLFPEFICAVLFTITFILLSVFIDAPLLNRANPDVTPNPSKAPWYFLNLQELLLHMDKAWAGVILPTIAIVALIIVPYFDRDEEGRGVWFGTKNAVKIFMFAAPYSVVVNTLLILFDAGKLEKLTRWVPGLQPITEQTPQGQIEVHKGLQSVKDFEGRFAWPSDLRNIPVPFNQQVCDVQFKGIHLWCDFHLNIPGIMSGQVIPLSLIFIFTVALVYILFMLGWLRTRRDLVLALFTGFFFTFLTLTVTGSFFRGPGQQLVPPWDIVVDEG